MGKRKLQTIYVFLGFCGLAGFNYPVIELSKNASWNGVPLFPAYLLFFSLLLIVFGIILSRFHETEE